jgi:hypothetical protein
MQNYYNARTNCCLDAARDCIPLTGNSRIRKIPDWSDSVQTFKDKALFWHRIWTDMGRPHDGIVARIRRTTRASHHRAIRQVLERKNDLIKNKLAVSILNNNSRDFGKKSGNL